MILEDYLTFNINLTKQFILHTQFILKINVMKHLIYEILFYKLIQVLD